MLSGVSDIFDICEGNKPIASRVLKSTTRSKQLTYQVHYNVDSFCR